MKQYTSGYCFTGYELYDTFNKKQLKISRDLVQRKYACNKKQRFCASVLCYCLYLIILDIIENNVTFVLPTRHNKEDATIYARPIVGEEFKQARQRGAFQDIDIISSNFTGYRLTLSWKRGAEYRLKPIYINKRFKDVFVKYINEGRTYY